MFFEKNQSLAGEKRFVYKQAFWDRMKNKLPGAQNWERLAQGDKLPEEYVHGQDIIGNQLRKLQSEAQTATQRSKTAQLLGKKGAASKATEKLHESESYLNKLNNPVESDSYSNSVKDLARLERIRSNLSDAELDQIDLEYLKDSAIGNFFSSKLRKQIENAISQMEKRDRLAVLMNFEAEAQAYAETEWKKKYKQADRTEKKQLKRDKTIWINKIALQYQAEKEVYLEDQEDKTFSESDDIKNLELKQFSDKNKENRIRNKKKEIEKTLQPLNSNLLSYEAKLELTQIALEAGHIKKKQIADHIKVRAEKLTKQLQNCKSLLGDDQYQRLKNILEAQLKDLSSSDILKEKSGFFTQVEKNIQMAELDLKNLGQQATIALNYEKSPEEYKKKFAGKIQYLSLSKTDPDKHTSTIATLETDLDRFDQMNAGEKAKFSSDLEWLTDRVKTLDGEKAKTAIHRMESLHSADDIRNLLVDLFGSERIDFTNRENFSQYGPNKINLNEYTQDGQMVFYERGDTWKIVVNQDDIKDVNHLKKQLTHELLHLEFESTDQIKREWRKRFTQSANWPEIRAAFQESWPNKKPPTGNNWQDDDILSELYAMQGDQIFNKPLKKEEHLKTPKDKLNQLIWNADHLNVNSSNYQTSLEDEIEKIRGYEQGADDDALAGATDATDAGDTSSGETTESVTPSNILKHRIKKAQDTLDAMKKSDYTSEIPGADNLLSVMSQFNNETQELNDAYASNGSAYYAEVIKERLEQVEKDIKELNEEMARIGDKVGNKHENIIRSLWSRSHFFTPEDFWQVGKDVVEWWKRRHDRKLTDHAARIGTSLADNVNLPWVGEFGMEARANKDRSEAKEVDEWKGKLENKDAWELQGMIKQMSGEVLPNPDQLKAVLRVLADKGRIDWRDPYLWKLLSKMQSEAYLSPDDETLLRNPILLRQKLHQAVAAIYDLDEFLDLERNNESNYDSGKQKYMGGLNKIQDQVGSRLDQLLLKHRGGGDVDPQEYEALIEYCISDAKAYAEQVMFHIIAGIASGLLSPDRGLALDKDPNQWPATNWIAAHKPPLTQKDYKYYVDTYFEKEYKEGAPGEEFMDFYWTVIQNNSSVIERTRKSVSDRKWDHDWSRSIAPMGDASTAKQFFSGRSSQQETKDTAVENSLCGAWMWLEKNAKHADKIDARKGFARQIAWLAMSDGILNRVAYQSNTTYARLNGSMLGNNPREGGLNHGDWTTRTYLSNIRSFMDQIDPTFFQLIRNEQLAKSNASGLMEAIKTHLSRYPGLAGELDSIQKLDDVFEKMDTIVAEIVSSVSANQFKRALQTIRTIGGV